jgi:hypothetical protein
MIESMTAIMRTSPAKTLRLNKAGRARLTSLLVAISIACAVGVAQTSLTKVVGTVKSVDGTTVVLTSDSGAEITLSFGKSARIVRTTPGQTDLKSATPIEVSDIQVGDRIAARGESGDDKLIVTSAIVMKQGDIADRQQRENDAWIRGIGGIVKEVNAAGGTITISNALAASGKPIVIHVSSQTDLKRYSPDSVKFDQAKAGTLDQIKSGDQLRARGTKNADGTEFTADAIVSGSFLDVAGTVVSTDAANNLVTLIDLATKKPVTIKVSADSQMRKLPEFVAMGIAMRLKGGGVPGAAAAAVASPGSAGQGMEASDGGRGRRQSARQGEGGVPGQGAVGEGRGGMRAGASGNWRGGSNGGAPDFQQMLNRLPAVSISGLNKGDAVMMVATEGASGKQPTAITLLTGVEPILSAAPAGTNAAATVLSPWNLGQGAPAGGDVGPQ